MKNVLHEAIHAMLYEYGLDRLNKEANVNALTTVFSTLLKIIFVVVSPAL